MLPKPKVINKPKPLDDNIFNTVVIHLLLMLISQFHGSEGDYQGQGRCQTGIAGFQTEAISLPLQVQRASIV